MCGIAGIFSSRINSSICPERFFDQVPKAISHRGPDDEGLFISKSQQAILAHTRLAILDLSSAGHQPMTTSDERYWITFNGEIYNFQFLRSQLQQEGVSFKSHTDTEVILKLYERHGSDCLKYLRGMFAFAIWDDWEQTAFLARDPLGIKPLYYWQSGTTLVFASELQAVLASGLPTKQISNSGLYCYLLTGSVSEPYTLIDQVFTLPAGHYLSWSVGETEINSYYQIDFQPQSLNTEALNTEEAVSVTRAALIDSVKHHLVSDVPVGIFLSGGIDSTALVALASLIHRGPLNTYSIAFEEPQWNEGDLAYQVAQTFGTNHTSYTLTASEGGELLQQYLTALDQPSIDGFNTFCVSRLAHQSGTKVVLSGLGGDEIFGGYQSFQKVPQLVRAGRNLQYLQPLTKGVGMVLERWGGSSRWRRLGDFLQQTPTPSTAYRCFRGVFSHHEACQILNFYLPDNPLPNRLDHENAYLPLSANLLDQVSWLEINHYMRNQLLKDSDVMSMRWGLELRVPLVDQKLLETVTSIPSSLRLQSGKKLLTQAVPEIPDWIVNRPKRGFAFPFEDWLKNDWQGLMKSNYVSNHIPLSPWYRRWSLAILDSWWATL